MDKHFGYSNLVIKAIDEDQRIITGIATTPEVDRVGDSVNPLGAKFAAELPLLWMHRHDLPVGTVKFGKPTKDGIPFTAKLPVINEPSQLKARIDEAWSSVKSKIVKYVSIGFRPIKYSIIEATGGLYFEETEIYELSLCTVAANGSATINEFKSLDREIRAALGDEKDSKVKDKPSGVSEKKPGIPPKSKQVKLETKEKEMSLTEKLKGFQDELKAKNAKLVELAEKSGEEGQTFDEADQEAFDTLNDEVKALESHIKRLEVAQKAAMSTAKPVEGDDEKKAYQSRGQEPVFARVKAAQKLDKGIGFARLARCKALAKMTGESATEIARANYGEESNVYGILKTAVAAGTTASNTSWAGPLVGAESDVYADFAEFLRPQTILGRMGTGNIPGVRTVPFRTRLVTGTSGGEGYWVGEGQAKPLTKFDFAGTTLEPLKVANIAVVSMELLRDSSPSAEAIVRDELAKALAARLDIDFLDPGKLPVAGVSPASVSFGVVPIQSSGTDADAVRCDLAALLQSYAAANNPPTSGVIVMSTNIAIALMGMRNALGQREFPDITMGGGILEGFPVLTSQHLANFGDSTGEFVFMVNASDIFVGDEGGVSVDMSDQASVQMDNDPAEPTIASTVLVSLWQRNLVGFRAERTINWAKRRASAVAVLGEVNYTACVSS
jgi:HK97 family phage major capsid protein/HK97 family phage prohead protease